MTAFVWQIIGGLILLGSWVAREMWGRRQERAVLEHRRALDGKARAEDAYLTCLTMRRVVDSIVYMQSVIGFSDAEPAYSTQPDRSRSRSPQEVQYYSWAQKVQNELDGSRKAYALERLRNVWIATKGIKPSAKQQDEWISKDEDEIKSLTDQLLSQMDDVGEKLEGKTRWADRIVAFMYVVGTLLVLVPDRLSRL